MPSWVLQKKFTPNFFLMSREWSKAWHNATKHSSFFLLSKHFCFCENDWMGNMAVCFPNPMKKNWKHKHLNHLVVYFRDRCTSKKKELSNWTFMKQKTRCKTKSRSSIPDWLHRGCALVSFLFFFLSSDAVPSYPHLSEFAKRDVKIIHCIGVATVQSVSVFDVMELQAQVHCLQIGLLGDQKIFLFVSEQISILVFVIRIQAKMCLEIDNDFEYCSHHVCGLQVRDESFPQSLSLSLSLSRRASLFSLFLPPHLTFYILSFLRTMWKIKTEPSVFSTENVPADIGRGGRELQFLLGILSTLLQCVMQSNDDVCFQSSSILLGGRYK